MKHGNVRYRLGPGVERMARPAKAIDKPAWIPRIVTIEGVEYEIAWDGAAAGPTLLRYSDTDPGVDFTRTCSLLPPRSRGGKDDSPTMGNDNNR